MSSDLAVGNDVHELSTQFSTRDDDDAPNSHSYVSGVYESKYQKSLRHYLTRESLPKESHYRNLDSIVDGNARPTLDDLHNATLQEKEWRSKDEQESQQVLRGKVIKFGWLEGVFMRCLLNIWGVMLFLRLSWVVGQAGIIQGLLIIFIANFVTMITAFSMSAVATNGRIKAVQALIIIAFANGVTLITAISMSAVSTNGQIKGGGIYYMISRSLGPEFGGSIGLMFTVANSIAVAVYIIGFCDSLKDMLWNYFYVTVIDGGLNDTRVVGTVTLILVLALAIVGMDWVTRVQMGLLFLLIGSQIDFIIGAFLGPLDIEEEAKGFLGLSGEVFQSNLGPDYRKDEGSEQNFFTVFAVFFPAVTGIVAGANLSGDLKDPGEAIPKGTILAIFTTFLTYMIYPLFIGSTTVRDASGNATVFNSSEPTLDNPAFTNASCNLYGEDKTLDLRDPCLYGLENSYQVMELVSAWGPLIYMGCFAATLSSAIASLVGAPRVLQALAKDKLYPGIFFFSKGYGANNDPVRGYILVFCLAFALIMVGNLNAVSTILSNFFLAAYSLINFSCFHASLVKSPGWRPAFKYYNLWVSLAGAFLCLVVMFLIDWIAALATFIITVALYLYVSYRKPDVNWGSSTQGQTYVTALKNVLELNTVEEHVKNYRPQVLVLSGSPGSRPPLIDFANSITKNQSLLVCGHIIKGSYTQRARNTLNRQAYARLERCKVKAFYSLADGEDLELGANSLFQVVGLGKLRPNIVLLGYKSNWATCDRAELVSYFNTIHKAFDMYFGVAILRLQNGLDYSQTIDVDENQDMQTPDALNPAGSNEDKKQDDDGSEASSPPTPEVERSSKEIAEAAKRKSSLADLYRGVDGKELSKEVLNQITIFQQKQKGNIDVWWLYDDGGLTLLIPHILTTRSIWGSCKLRVFAMANRKNELAKEQRSMANLLAKFRIDFSALQILPDLAKKASEDVKTDFQHLIEDFVESDSNPANNDCTISDGELIGQREKTNRHLRLRQFLMENSKDSSLIVMTLPMPRKGTVSAPLYMAWLEALTRDMPPFLLIRGNQSSVLTFYS